jgi:glutamate dehydrogenase
MQNQFSNNIESLFNDLLQENPIVIVEYKKNLSQKKSRWIVESIATYIAKSLQLYSFEDVVKEILSNKDIFREILDYFLNKFDPSKSVITKNFSTGSEILDLVFKVINATVRTNFFAELSDKFIVLKIHAQSVKNSSPVLFETFIYSDEMEGIHMRGAAVSRGGIRCSNRIQDYPVEVLSLVTAQIQKNAAIIPSGAKGGFIVKSDVFNPIDAYDCFIRGLLSISDNIVDGKVLHVENVKRLDGVDDTYLVVAADKGTATFSDYANGLSEGMNFWLGDAFASGGSNGYDHKETGITSRGTLVATEHHFANIGVDLYNDCISVIGIGGMSGDVFGNAMTIMKKIRLIAAFSHSHIFLDPNPNIDESYKERQRLFDAVLSWKDYDKSKISQGGGVFDANQDRIDLTPEIKALLEISEDYCSGPELIKHILRAKADLLFFGGIGTFVKASFESNEQAKDRDHDSKRVNASELRVKVISEGANLAMTRNSRIEAARNGMHLNTDGLDNFSGVNCSDHEVNLKILWKSVELGKRNKLVKEVQKEVIEMILKCNYDKNIALLLEYSLSNTDRFKTFVLEMNKIGLIDKNIFGKNLFDYINNPISKKISFTRPEVAELMSIWHIFMKNSMKNLDEDIIKYYSSKYFPDSVVKDYSELVDSHILRKDIAISEITNLILSSFGPSFVLDLCQRSGFSIDKCVSYMARINLNTNVMYKRLDFNKNLINTNQLSKIIDKILLFDDNFMHKMSSSENHANFEDMFIKLNSII